MSILMSFSAIAGVLTIFLVVRNYFSAKEVFTYFERLRKMKE